MKTPEIIVCLFILLTVAVMAITAMAKSHRKPRERGRRGATMAALFMLWVAPASGGSLDGVPPDNLPALTDCDYHSRTMGKVDEKIAASPYQKGAFTVNPFAAGRVVDSEVTYGGGLAVGYAITDRLTIEADVISEGIDDSNWQDTLKSVGAGVKFYFPIKATGFAPYLIGGYQRDLIDHENRLQAGAGVEYRFGKLPIAVFVDAQVNHGFEQELRELGNDVRVRAGLGYQFR